MYVKRPLFSKLLHTFGIAGDHLNRYLEVRLV